MDTFYRLETARFEIDPQKSHLGMPIHWLSAPFSGGASTEATFQGKPLRDWAIFEEEGSLSFFENELFCSIRDGLNENQIYIWGSENLVSCFQFSKNKNFLGTVL